MSPDPRHYDIIISPVITEKATMATEPWLALFPGLAILLSVLTVNALGEWLNARRLRSGT